MRLKFILLLIVTFGWGFTTVAMKPYIPRIINPLTESWRWKNFPELEGKGVRDIAEGKDGTVWIGVDDGVFEYNGYEWKLHKSQENGLANAPIEQVLVSQNGQVYAVTAQQLYRYEGGHWQPLLQSPKGFNFYFSKILECSDGSIMVASQVGVLHLKNSDKPIFYTASNQIEGLTRQQLNFEWKRFPEILLEGGSYTEISDILEDASGKLWLAFTFGESGKLLRFAPPNNTSPYITNYEYYTSGDKLQFGEGQKLIQASDNKVWVINSSSRVPTQIYSEGEWTSVRLSEQFGGDEYTNDIVQTNDGTIWIGALGKLYSHKDEKWAIYEAPKFKIPANKLLLYKSENDKLWISGLRSKVNLLDYSSNRWISYEGLNFECELSNTEQWFLHVDGDIISKNGNRWLAWGVEEGLIDAPVKVIVTKKGQIWAAGSHEGVAATAYLKDEKWHKQLHPTLSWGIDYRAVFEAKDGSIWFGGSVDPELEKEHLGGVLQLVNPLVHPLDWRHYKYNENGLGQSNAYGIAQTPDGKIWIGGSGLTYFDGEKWKRPENERLRQFVNIVANTDDLLIVGSRYYGIYIFDGKNWKNYTTESGLVNNTIISINAISKDNIWVATENDICHFDGIQWQNNIFPKEMNMDFEGGDIQHSSDGAIWVNRSDRSWKRRAFSHNRSKENIYNNFVTYKYTPDNIAPETEITFFSEEVSPNGNTLIQWKGKDFFEETPNENLSYSFRLNDGDWSLFSSKNQHTFLSLPNGTHRLEVRAMDLASNIDTTPAIVEFLVHPPVWKQLWFIALVTAFLTIISIFGYNIFTKNKKLEKLNKSLHVINDKIKAKGKKIRSQNKEILQQQKLILKQTKSLEASNENLEEQNHEIQTQRDQLEEMVEQVEELSKAKLSFFTNISHELRTPLSLILGPINQLKNTEEKLSDEERKKLYGIAERNATRLLKLINQLLELRRIENSSMELQLREINLKDFLVKITELFQNLSRKRKIPLHFNASLEDPISMLDADKVEKIIVNLLSNAFKHTPDGEAIQLNLKKVSAKEYNLNTSHESYFLIQVKDSGKGIEPEALEHIFERYYHKKSLNNEQDSSGIGLSYIKDLIEIHQGFIEVDSEVGKGSQFNVFIPILRNGNRLLDENNFDLEYQFAQQEIQSALEEITEDLVDANLVDENEDLVTSTNDLKSTLDKEKTRILVVEDNKDMMTFLVGLLQNQYHVLTAYNGKEALEIAQSHHLDLILSDVMMPEMDGLEFCKKIKSNFATSHLPLILLTAKSLEEHELEGYEIGANDYVTKPFNPQILDLKIKNILNQRAAFQTKITREYQIAPKEIQLTSPDEEMLNNLVTLMEKNIANSEFNVNSMCQSVNLSHMHFIRKVKQLTGKRPVDLLKSFRMKRAKDLLAQNKMTISEIAYSVGFEMPSSFSRAFKKEFGESPTAFLTRSE